MRYPHLWTRLYNVPLLIEPAKAVVIESVFRAHLEGGPSPQAMEEEGRSARRPAAFTYNGVEKPYQITPTRIALIPIVGTLVQRGSWMDAMSGIASYDRIGALVNAAAADHDVAGILLEIDSPGGEATGLFELAARIHAVSKTKPVWAVANEMAYSAAYAISAAAGRLYTPQSGGLGSIGVIALHVDQSQRDQKQGYQYTAIYAGARKNDLSSHQPLNDAGRAAIEEIVNRMYGMFTGGVAKMRGVSEDSVRATEAALLSPEQAIKLGLADGVATLSETLKLFEAAFRNGTALATGAPAAAAHQFSKENHMNAPTTAANAGAGKTYTQAELDAAIAEIRASSAAEGKTLGVKEGAEAERARVNAILNCEEAKGRGKLAAHLAMETSMDVDAAKKMLAAAAIEAAVTKDPLSRAMATAPNPKVGADTGGDGGDKPQPKIERSADTFARRAEQARQMH